MIRPEIFELAARESDKDCFFTCNALRTAKASEEEKELWAECHRPEDLEGWDTVWFGHCFPTDNTLLREQLLREMAINLREQGFA